ncbi:MAG: bifunctional folylpolyglutamate synthase/dihydrofolate synthase [Dehalococcoidales bacterium]|nr:bifunctional folylpolyglutamate synthase/dihydrofolate synthase [Dehalococcoidales bacterium]
MVTYQQALDYIYSFVDYENQARPRDAANYDLRRMDELLERVGNPHLKARTVHIAGTKGKGSTAALIESVLRHSGYTTGLFTSPHLHTFNERIRANGELIPDEDVIRLVELIQPEVAAVNERAAYGKLTTFEIMTAMGFMYFDMKNVDVRVIEVGLGGRLDATNVVEADVSIITTIGFDHTEVLGNTLSAIAGEKAGIIRPGGTVVSSLQAEEADKVIVNRCNDLLARLIKVGRDVTWQSLSYGISGQRFNVQGAKEKYELEIPLLGDHQLNNATTAVAALEVLADKGLNITKETIAEGFAAVKWPGRLQILARDPLLVVDGAHTPDSARRVRESIEKYFDYEQAILIIGSSSDKDIAGIVNELAPVFNQVVVTRSIHPRSMPANRIIEEFAKKGVEGKTATDITEAFSMALELAGKHDLVCATGSLFIVAGIIEEAEKRGLFGKTG